MSDEQAAKRFRITLELFAAGVEIKRAALKRQYPAQSREERQRELERWLEWLAELGT